MKRILIIIIVLFVLAGCKSNKEEDTVVSYTKQDNTSEILKSYILEHLDALEQSVEKMSKTTNIEESKLLFAEAKDNLKTIECFLIYITPKKMKGVNGPPLPVFREDNGKVLPPIGFQAIEEQLYAEDTLDEGLYLKRIKILSGYLKGIKQTIIPANLGYRHLFIPLHQQLFSIFSLGIISFDTPASLRGFTESIVALESMKTVYGLTIRELIQERDKGLDERFISHVDEAIQYLSKHSDFETFDRYEFTRNYINDLTKDWRDIRIMSGLFETPSRLALNMDAPTFFEENSFNTNFFLRTKNTPNESMVKLGKALFFDKNISASGTMACATCHQPELAYQDGLPKAIGKNGKVLERNTPTLINSVFQRKFFWDGRSDDLKQQINLVFENEDEFDRSSAHVFSLKKLDSLKYYDLVVSAFPDTKKLTKKTVSRAIASYVSTLNAFNSRFDKNMRGELSDFTAQERLGMNIYMGKALCATCHFLPLTSGTVPPNLKETEKEVIGTPRTKENKEIDPDVGFYWVYEEDIHKFMFKTPGIRNAELTAPYMHNGVYTTLEEVMDFYNKGGGGGMGFDDLDHQTLPFDNLNLTEEEIDALVAFTKTFTDTDIKE